ncbi:YjzD family protein [Priestia taiwanensis]|uniref:DUF2929 domain-containing protein n=1 Tax=Priestia taiwanensis TaxID=1347902 RepID=A0A917ASC4_9BACI|nr:YjzD family protein [Priestia taiwanensis]MBM7364177.1 putative PurR-regulated permease PerM [Priestia taiwanensis]GGE72257.1 DUF2929 domain-containing protein [Priestia taiwanensis]
MRYFWTLFWAFALSNMFAYVVGAMKGMAYDFQLACTLTVIFTVGVILLSSIIPNEPVEQHH